MVSIRTIIQTGHNHDQFSDQTIRRYCAPYEYSTRAARGCQTEFDLLGALFAPAGRADPQVILRGSPLPGRQYLFVRDVLRDPRFAAPTIPPSPDPAFQLLRR
jgi:hypothetical protein